MRRPVSTPPSYAWTRPRRTYTVSCLAGHGIGPEVMAEASRALRRVSRLHGFRVEELHSPFGAEAVTQSGNAFPASTREATLRAHAVLVASTGAPALAGVESELDLRARVDRVVFAPRGQTTVLCPLDDTALEWTLERGFDVARSSRALITVVAPDSRWEEALRDVREGHSGIHVERLSVGDALQGLAFDPDRFDVVVASVQLGEALVGAAASGRRARVAASGRLAAAGPSVFSPAHGPAVEIAGQGVANPASMLLAAALLLGEGLRERSAAQTLAGAVLEACCNGSVTPDLVTTGVGATTREFGDAVLAELPFAVTNAEFFREAVERPGR